MMMASNGTPLGLENCTCNDMGEEDYSAEYAMYNYVSVMIILPFVAAFGVVSNIINIYIFTRPSMQSSVNIYLLALSCSDLFVVSSGVFVFYSDSVRVYAPSFTDIATKGIIWILPLGYIAQTCSVYFTVAAAGDCYVKLCWHRLSVFWCKTNKAKILVGLITGFSLAYNALRFWQFRLKHCWNVLHNSSNIEVCPTELYYDIEVVYNVYMYMILMTVLPFMLLSILNVLILRTIQRVRRMNQILQTAIVQSAAAQTNRLLRLRSVDRLESIDQLSYADSINHSANPINCSPINYSAKPINCSASPINHSAKPISCSPRPINCAVTPTLSKSYQLSNGGRSKSLDRFKSIDQYPSPPNRQLSTLSSKLGSTGDDSVTTMVMVVILFLACNTLALIVNIVEAFFQPEILVIQYMSDTSNLLVVFNSSVNYVIYMLFDGLYCTQFKQCTCTGRIRSLFIPKLKHRHSPGPVTNGTQRKRAAFNEYAPIPTSSPTQSSYRSKSLSQLHSTNDLAMIPLITAVQNKQQKTTNPFREP